MNDFSTGQEPGETMLADRLSAAVGDVRPDALSLMSAGVLNGRRRLRRRRLQSAALGAAVVVTLTGGLTYAASQTDLLGHRGDETTDRGGEVVQLEQATPRGLAAALLDKASALGEPVAVGGWHGDETMPGSLVVQARFEVPGTNGVELDLIVSPDVASFADGPCAATNSENGPTCDEVTLADGTRVGYFEGIQEGDASSPSKDQYVLVGVIAVRADGVVTIVESVSGSVTPVSSREELVAIATDPLVGFSTRSDFNEQGQEITDFKDAQDSWIVEGDDSASSSGGGSSASSEAPPKQ
jgi:hypothetical protein